MTDTYSGGVFLYVFYSRHDFGNLLIKEFSQSTFKLHFCKLTSYSIVIKNIFNWHF